MQAVKSEFKVTYYVGTMLAQGGVLIIDNHRLLFVPGIIERKLGADDEEILFENIKMVEVTGVITESLIVRTQKKAHRFVGSDLSNVSNIINNAVNSYQMSNPTSRVRSPVATSSHQTAPRAAPSPQTETPTPTTQKTEFLKQCSSCHKGIRNDFNFCPHCSSVIQPSCSVCHKYVEPSWKFCAFCSQEI